MDSNKWINDIREIKKYNDAILSLRNGHWQVKDKDSVLSRYASFFYDHHLDLIKSATLKTLKDSKCSPALRRGIAETIIFLGVHGKNLKNCTQPKPEDTATLIIRELFKDANWKLWVSVNDVLPLLAEADPNEFLSSVENLLHQEPCLFDEIYKRQGSDIIIGGYNMQSIYWALTRLAWSADYLSRAVLALAELATHYTDTETDNWANNHPAHSIIIILLPWFPQTTAPVNKRIAALKGIQRNFPKIAWHILLSLLPNQHHTSIGTHKPKYRNFIPDTWKQEVSNSEYWQQVKEYAAMAVEMAKGHIERIVKLVENLDNLPQPALGSFLEYLSSKKVLALTDEDKQPIWETMQLLIKKHRQFHDTTWALPTETINLFEETANKLAPSNPEILCRHLFFNDALQSWNQEEGSETAHKKMQSQRIEALKQIYLINKTASIITLSENVGNSYAVGDSFAQIADEYDDGELLPSFLDSQDSPQKQFIRGYVSGRFCKNGIEWFNGLHNTNWSLDQKCELLLKLPFENEIWQKADKLLGNNVGDYWKKITANQLPAKSNLLPAIENLLKYDRPRLAIECIFSHQYNKRGLPPKELTVKALLNGANSAEQVGGMDAYYVNEIIKILQDDPDIKEDDLLSIEWAYLQILNHDNDAKPKILEKSLSQKPEFFVKVIQSLYHSEEEDETEKEIDEKTQAFAEKAWKLLHYWRRPPGTMDDGTFSANALKEWHATVKAKTTESGHFEVAMTHLGYVLFYAGIDPNGLWIQQSVAELIDEADNDIIRQSFTTEILNSRGAHAVDPSGKSEKELAEHWRKNAEDVENIGLVRFASALKDLARSYDREAERVIAESIKDNDSDDKNAPEN